MSDDTTDAHVKHHPACPYNPTCPCAAFRILELEAENARLRATCAALRGHVMWLKDQCDDQFNDVDFGMVAEACEQVLKESAADPKDGAK